MTEHQDAAHDTAHDTAQGTCEDAAEAIVISLERQARGELFWAQARLAAAKTRLCDTVRMLLILTGACAYACVLGLLVKVALNR